MSGGEAVMTDQEEKRLNRAREHQMVGMLRKCRRCGRHFCQICTCACEREEKA